MPLKFSYWLSAPAAFCRAAVVSVQLVDDSTAPLERTYRLALRVVVALSVCTADVLRQYSVPIAGCVVAAAVPESWVLVPPITL